MRFKKGGIAKQMYQHLLNIDLYRDLSSRTFVKPMSYKARTLYQILWNKIQQARRLHETLVGHSLARQEIEPAFLGTIALPT